MNKLFLCVTVLALSACSSAPQTAKVATPESVPDSVLSRIDDLKERPSWLHESEPFKIDNGTVISLGQTTIPSDNRVEAAYRIAQNNGKAAIAGAIEQKLEFIFQNAEEGTSLDSTQARYIGAEATNLVTSSIRIGRQYWEKVAMTTDSGERVTRYKVFTTVTMPETDFKNAVMTAIHKAQGKGGLSQDFAQKVNQQWDKFTGAPTQPQQSEKRDTANAVSEQ
jgi:hypothetical protein